MTGLGGLNKLGSGDRHRWCISAGTSTPLPQSRVRVGCGARFKAPARAGLAAGARSALRELTCGSCLNVESASERSEFCRTAASPALAGLPAPEGAGRLVRAPQPARMRLCPPTVERILPEVPIPHEFHTQRAAPSPMEH